MKAWVNGREARLIDVGDRGLQYGDGVFETMRMQRGTIRLLEYHLERLQQGCTRLAIRVPHIGRLRRDLLGAAAQRRDGVLKLIITRGAGARGYRPSGRERPTRIMAAYPLPRAAATRAVGVRLCSTRLGCNEALAGLKTLNRLESVLARAEWSDLRIWDGLMRDADDNIVCGTMSNLFLRHRNTLVTPRIDRCGVAGVMRRWVMEQAADMNMELVVTHVRWTDLRVADEAFLTNAVAGIVAIASIARRQSRLRLPQHRTAHGLRRRLELQ